MQGVLSICTHQKSAPKLPTWLQNEHITLPKNSECIYDMNIITHVCILSCYKWVTVTMHWFIWTVKWNVSPGVRQHTVKNKKIQKLRFNEFCPQTKSRFRKKPIDLKLNSDVLFFVEKNKENYNKDNCIFNCILIAFQAVVLYDFECTRIIYCLMK